MTTDPPHLDFDLGRDFCAGDAVHIDFRLNCAGYLGTPIVQALLSPLLTQTHWLEFPPTRPGTPGVWEFRQSFLLRAASGGTDCARGDYPIDFTIDFPPVPGQPVQRFLHATLRLHVPANDSGNGANGQRRVEIQGADMSIIDVDELSQLTDSASDVTIVMGKSSRLVSRSRPANGPVPASSGRHYSLPLKFDLQRLQQTPFPSRTFTEISQRDTLSLQCLDPRGGRRTLLFARHELRYGGMRTSKTGEPNDLIFAWIPLTPAHRALWDRISARHGELQLNREGILICDANSKNGTQFNHNPVLSNTPVLCRAGDPTGLLRIADGLEFQVDLQSSPPDGVTQPNRAAPPDRVYAAVLGLTTEPTLWAVAKQANLDSARVRRMNNLVEEEYVLLCRQAILGPRDSAAVTLCYDDGADDVARILHAAGGFWFERLSDAQPVRVDEYEPVLRELVPLKPGMTLCLGRNRLEVREGEQDLRYE